MSSTPKYSAAQWGMTRDYRIASKDPKARKPSRAHAKERVQKGQKQESARKNAVLLAQQQRRGELFAKHRIEPPKKIIVTQAVEVGTGPEWDGIRNNTLIVGAEPVPKYAGDNPAELYEFPTLDASISYVLVPANLSLAAAAKDAQKEQKEQKEQKKQKEKKKDEAWEFMQNGLLTQEEEEEAAAVMVEETEEGEVVTTAGATAEDDDDEDATLNLLMSWEDEHGPAAFREKEKERLIEEHATARKAVALFNAGRQRFALKKQSALLQAHAEDRAKNPVRNWAWVGATARYAK